MAKGLGGAWVSGVVLAGAIGWGAVALLPSPATTQSEHNASSSQADTPSPAAKLLSGIPDSDSSGPAPQAFRDTREADSESDAGRVRPFHGHRHDVGHHDVDGCSDEEYRSSDGACVHRPFHTNRHVGGETAVSRDGTHSMSHHHRGTCSHHGGVASWD